MGISIVMKEQGVPAEPARRQGSLLGIGSVARIVDGLPPAEQRPRGRRGEVGDRSAIGRDGQDRLVAGRGAEAVEHYSPEPGPVVGQLGVAERVGRGGGAGDVDLIALPLIAQWRGSGGPDREGGATAHRYRL